MAGQKKEIFISRKTPKHETWINLFILLTLFKNYSIDVTEGGVCVVAEISWLLSKFEDHRRFGVMKYQSQAIVGWNFWNKTKIYCPQGRWEAHH